MIRTVFAVSNFALLGLFLSLGWKFLGYNLLSDVEEAYAWLNIMLFLVEFHLFLE